MAAFRPKPIIDLVQMWQYKVRASLMKAMLDHVRHVTEARFAMETMTIVIWMMDRELRPVLQFTTPSYGTFCYEAEVMAAATYVFTLSMLDDDFSIITLGLPTQKRRLVHEKMLSFLKLEPVGAFFPHLLFVRHVKVLKTRIDDMIKDFPKEKKTRTLSRLSSLFFEVAFMLAAAGMLSTCGDRLVDNTRDDTELLWLDEFIFMDGLTEDTLCDCLNFRGGKIGKRLLRCCVLLIQVLPAAAHFSTGFECVKAYKDRTGYRSDSSVA